MHCAISELLKNKPTDWKICIKFAADTRDSSCCTYYSYMCFFVLCLYCLIVLWIFRLFHGKRKKS